MQIAMQERTVAELMRRIDRVQSVVQVRERAHVSAKPPRSSSQVVPHARPIDAVEHESVGTNVVHTRDGIAVCARVLHHERFARRVTADAVPAQHCAAAEVNDVRLAPPADQRSVHNRRDCPQA